MRAFLLCVLILHGTFADGAEQRPIGKNCDLHVPPKGSGEEVNHGILHKIYPRAREISKDYTGCQLLWMHDGNTWITLAVVAIERGYAVRLWSQHETDPVRLACRYKEGKVVQGDPQSCPAPDFLIVKSLPPGCVERIKKAGRFPPGCDYD